MQKARLLILVTLLALGLVPASGFSAAAQESEALAFATPEDAIAHFFEGITEGDFAKILQASAVNEMSEGFAFDLYVDRLRAFMPFQTLAPADYPLYVEINRAESTARLANQVKLFSYSLLAEDDIELDRTIVMELAEAQSLLSQFDPTRLAALEVIELGIPNPTLMNSDRHKENATRLAVPYGADESTERVALIAFEQHDYVLGFSLLRYGDNWKIYSLSSPLAGTPIFGTAAPITREAFASLTS